VSLGVQTVTFELRLTQTYGMLYHFDTVLVIFEGQVIKDENKSLEIAHMARCDTMRAAKNKLCRKADENLKL